MAEVSTKLVEEQGQFRNLMLQVPKIRKKRIEELGTAMPVWNLRTPRNRGGLPIGDRFWRSILAIDSGDRFWRLILKKGLVMDSMSIITRIRPRILVYGKGEMARLTGKQSCKIEGVEFEVTLHEGRITSGNPKRRLVIVESPTTPQFLRSIEAAVGSLVRFGRSDREMPFFIDRLVLDVHADCTTNSGVTCHGSAVLETDPPSTVIYDDQLLQDRSFFTFKTDSTGLERLREKLNVDGKCSVRFL